MRALLLILTLILSACTASEGAMDKVEAARERNDGPAIWVARDADSTLYLYGTIHLIPVATDWQRDDLWNAFERAGTVWFEVASDETTRTKADRLTRQYGFLPPNQRLSRNFDNYETRLLEAAALSADIPLPVLETMRPWLASDIITIAAAKNAGLSASLAPDEAIKSRARRSRKFVRYLDTIEDQIALSSDAPLEDQTTSLRKTLEDYNRIGPELLAIAESWVAGDVPALTTRLGGAMEGATRERLLTTRNESWADELAEFLDGSGTGFAAVGVAHLVGEDTLQDALGERGYTVERYLAYQGENVLKTIDLTPNSGPDTP